MVDLRRVHQRPPYVFKKKKIINNNKKPVIFFFFTCSDGHNYGTNVNTCMYNEYFGKRCIHTEYIHFNHFKKTIFARTSLHRTGKVKFQ